MNAQLAELISIFTNNIAPILIVAGVGYWTGRQLNIKGDSLGKLIFNVFSPALVFHLLSTSAIDGQEFSTILIATILFQLIMAIIATAIMRHISSNRIHRASITLSAFCLNAGNYGLSLVLFAFGEEILARAVVVFIANVILNNTLGVYIASSGRRPPLAAVKSILKVPAVYATLLAFIVKSLNITVPLPLSRSVELMGNAAIPAMLILLGLQLRQTTSIAYPKLISLSVVLKLLLAPVIAIGIAILLGLNDFALTAFIVQAATPTAVVTIVLAGEFELDTNLTSAIILVTTLLSPLSLSIIILLLQQTVLQ